ncbi:ankyrin repeat domain-containing protein [Legionella bononiensis]|uniref:Ankyrin repeat domain-containing protein n=1 Tax=Legionella bononiensis TaxID=2793102 RepID=A0ABS1WF62_9GAMM|nr:ankyrin repeat domain-containing protein [Legionella bononiensis]MBL7479278.1 ankyrin repeat domain-containing protein [Legionella bononiensis]MBL7527994.1 ankyrin repeat domain-containing protein [Legionella bononiensis]MBL7563929.1 ankyrin repeat domain-containing protein [Legionella bononiensis]
MGIELNSDTTTSDNELFQFLLQKEQIEHPGFSAEQQNENARVHAHKLAVLFGNLDSIKGYLDRFQKLHKNTRQPVHDACLFNIPTGDNWSPERWRRLIADAQPSSPQDTILRLAPFFAKIEAYIANKENKSRILTVLTEIISKNYERELKEEFHNIQDFDLFFNKRYSKKIRKEVDKILENEARRFLAQNDRGKLNAESHKKIKQFKQENIKQITDTVTEQYKGIAQEEIQNLWSKAQTEDQYIDEKLKKNKHMINRKSEDAYKKFLSLKTPLPVIALIANQIVYDRASENPEAAALFFKYSIPEAKFDEYLSLKPQDDEKAIPNVTLLGADINPGYADYRLQKLSPSDPQAAILGKLTSCCQFMGGQGESCAVDGITNPNGGFYTVTDKNQNIVAQCWAFRAKDGSMVLDSIESPLDFRNKPQNSQLLADLFMSFAKQLCKVHQVPRVLVGTGGQTQTVFNNGLLKAMRPGQLPGYGNYRDSVEQYVLAMPNFPLLEWIYHKANPQSKLDFLPQTAKTKVLLDEQQIMSWCELAYKNGKEWDIRDKYPVDFALSNQAITQIYCSIEHNVQLSEEWKSNMLYIDTDYIWERCKVLIPQVDAAYTKGHLGTMMTCAAKLTQWDKVKYLIEHQVEIVEAGPLLDQLFLHGQYELIQIVFSTLIKQGVALQNIQLKQHPSMMFALIGCPVPLITFGLEHGVDINSRHPGTSKKITLLHYATQQGGVDQVQFFLERFDINSVDTDQSTPLHYAIMNSNWDVVKFLILKGADVFALNTKGKTPFLMLINEHQWELIELVIENYPLATENLPSEFVDFQLRKTRMSAHNVDSLPDVEGAEKSHEEKGEDTALVNVVNPVPEENSECVINLSQLIVDSNLPNPNSTSIPQEEIEDNTRVVFVVSENDSNGGGMDNLSLIHPPIDVSDSLLNQEPQEMDKVVDNRSNLRASSLSQPPSLGDTSSKSSGYNSVPRFFKPEEPPAEKNHYPIWLILLFLTPVIGQLAFLFYKIFESFTSNDTDCDNLDRPMAVV